nr:T9SS type A sorting domain-containing protein [FCB group bacterium]
YEVLRIDGWGYTNSLFLNNKVLVPQLSDPLDARALETWAEAMPGYEVLGFTGNFGSHDAIHCRTMGMTDRYMLRIVHIPLHDRENNGGDYLVEARIHPYSNEPLVGSPLINWKIEGGIYNTVSMTNISGDDFIGNLPQQPDGTDIYYYLSAEDESGRQENHPFIGEGNPHHFFAGPDTIPPYVDWEMAPPSFITVENWPLALTAKVMDNLWVSSVTLEYMINGIPQDTVEMSLQPLSAVCYDGALTGEIHPYDLIQLRLKAVDTSINQNITYDPPAGYYTIDVEGSARTCVWNACGQSSGQVIYEMLERAGIQSVYTLEEPGNLNRFENMFIFLGVTPYSYVIDEDQEDAIVDYINSGHNVYLEGGDCWVWDPNHEELCQVFGIIGLDDGEELESPILGVEDTFTEGMSFDYVSTNNHIDQVEPAAGAELIFQYDDIGIGVANQTHTHSTVGLCFEFSGLAGNNPVSSQENLFRQILHYFYPTQPEVAGLGLDGVSDALPDQYSLAQNYPNPFNPVTTLNYYLPEAGEVLLTIYDIQGREAARLVDGHLSSGEHTVDWNAADFASGIYFARLDNGKVQITQKLLLIK